jgi:hypothetical protein
MEQLEWAEEVMVTRSSTIRQRAQHEGAWNSPCSQRSSVERPGGPVQSAAPSVSSITDVCRPTSCTSAFSRLSSTEHSSSPQHAQRSSSSASAGSSRSSSEDHEASSTMPPSESAVMRTAAPPSGTEHPGHSTAGRTMRAYTHMSDSHAPYRSSDRASAARTPSSRAARAGSCSGGSRVACVLMRWTVPSLQSGAKMAWTRPRPDICRSAAARQPQRRMTCGEGLFF